MRNKVRKWAIYMTICMSVTGCINSNIISNDQNLYTAAIDKNEQILLSIGKGRGYFYHSDYLRLEKFVKTAKPNEMIRWRKYSMRYTLVSQSIFLDEKARPCRRYQIKANSFLPLTKSINCIETACRFTDGKWRTVSASDDGLL